jgi:hypothetical protein
VEVDLPEIVAELGEAFAAYERALVCGDAEALVGFFWRDPRTLRYGTADVQYSHAEIADFRRRPGAKSPPRSLHRTRITTFGRDLGVGNTEFVRAGSDRTGRQSQTWVRMPEGWKIVGAHVSFPCEG